MGFDGSLKTARVTRWSSTGLVATGCIVTLGFLLVGWAELQQIAQRDYASARTAATNVVATISADISRNLESFDLSLQAAADGIRLPGIDQVSPHMRHLILFDRAATAKNLGLIRVLDRDGNVVADSSGVQNSRNYSSREYFKYHLTHGDDERHITEPWINSRGEYVIGVSRRVNDVDGSFMGVVVGTMKLSYFRDLMSKIALGDGDTLTLTTRNGTILMRAPFDDTMIGRRIGGTSVFNKILASASGIFEDTAILDGVRRVYVFKHVEDSPLIISNALSVDRIYSGWRAEAMLIGSLIFSLCAINIALIVFLSRALMRRALAENDLAKLASVDSLTGLNNRRRFDQLLGDEWNRMRRQERPVSLLMIDADHFKAYNDRFGHQTGDVALATIADCIARATKRAGEHSARYGGEEFAVILSGQPAERAAEIAGMIRDNLASLNRHQRLPFGIPTVSIGIASLVPQADWSPGDLIQAADTALYQAKEAGRDRYAVAPSQLALLAKKMAA